MFCRGEEDEVRFETYTRGEQPHVVCTAKGASPNLYGEPGELFYFGGAREVTHRVVIDTVPVEIVQEP